MEIFVSGSASQAKELNLLTLYLDLEVFLTDLITLVLPGQLKS